MKSDVHSSDSPAVPDIDFNFQRDDPREEPVVNVPRRRGKPKNKDLQILEKPVLAPKGTDSQVDIDFGFKDDKANSVLQEEQVEEVVLERAQETGKKLTEWLGETFSRENLDKARDKIRKITGGLTGKETIILPVLGMIGRFTLTHTAAANNPNLVPLVDALAGLGFAGGNAGMALANRLEAHPEIAYKYGRPLKLMKRVCAEIVLTTMGYGVDKIGEGAVNMVNDNILAVPAEEPVVGGISPDERSAEAQPAGGAVTEVSPSATSSPTLTETPEPTASSTPAPVTETATQIEVPTSSATAVGDLHSISTDTPSPIPSAVSSLEPSSSATATHTPTPTLIGGEPTGTPEVIPAEGTSSETPAVETATPSPLPTETVTPEAATAPGGETAPVEIPVAPSEGEVGLTPPDLTPEPEVNTPLENAVDGIPGNYSHAGRDYWYIAESATENTADTAGLSEGGRNILTDALKDVIHGPDVTAEDWQNAALRIDHTLDKLDRLLLNNAFVENLDFHNSMNDARINEILENVYKTEQLPNLLTAADLRKLEEISMMSGG